MNKRTIRDRCGHTERSLLYARDVFSFSPMRNRKGTCVSARNLSVSLRKKALICPSVPQSEGRSHFQQGGNGQGRYYNTGLKNTEFCLHRTSTKDPAL